MKYLVLGCNGMAGHMIFLYLKEKSHDVTGFARKRIFKSDMIIGDAFDLEGLKNTVLSGGFDVVINCIGILNERAEQEKHKAVFLNSYLPHFLAEITKHSKTQIVQISTDCVFSGKKGNYALYDIKDGNSFYDRSKALGELDDKKNLTLRGSIVGPDIQKDGMGLLNWFMHQGGTRINGYTHAIWTGQTTLQLAKTIEFCTENSIVGIYNAVPECSISKYELLCLFNHYIKNDVEKIIPQDQPQIDKSLIASVFPYDYCIPDYQEMLQELSVWMKEHCEIYPHYKL